MPRGIPNNPRIKTEQSESGVIPETTQKDGDKNIRAPIGEEKSVNKLSQTEKIRLAMGKQTRLDASFYERLPEYQDMQLFWENDTDGAVEKWLELGAQPVPRKSRSVKSYEGITDSSVSQWEVRQVGAGVKCYLMFMPADEYQALRIDPKEARNAELTQAMGIGKVSEDARVMPGVKGIKTYAPNLPTGGGRGFEQIHDA